MQQIDHHNLARENEIAAVDPLFGIEVHGLDPIPSEHRHGQPRELLWTWLGGNFNYVVLASGAFTILFGLSFWQAITAAIVGSVLGANTVNLSSTGNLLLRWKKRINHLNKILKALLGQKGLGRRQMALFGFVLIVDLLDFTTIDA